MLYWILCYPLNCAKYEEIRNSFIPVNKSPIQHYRATFNWD